MKTNKIRKQDKYFSKFIQIHFVYIEIEGGRVACSVFTLFFPAWPRMLVIYVTHLIPQHLKIKKKNKFWNLHEYIQKIIQILFCRWRNLRWECLFALFLPTVIQMARPLSLSSFRNISRLGENNFENIDKYIENFRQIHLVNIEHSPYKGGWRNPSKPFLLQESTQGRSHSLQANDPLSFPSSFPSTSSASTFSCPWFFHTVVSGHQSNQSPDHSMLLELSEI